jgi:hypothetical protein
MKAHHLYISSQQNFIQSINEFRYKRLFVLRLWTPEMKAMAASQLKPNNGQTARQRR